MIDKIMTEEEFLEECKISSDNEIPIERVTFRVETAEMIVQTFMEYIEEEDLELSEAL